MRAHQPPARGLDALTLHLGSPFGVPTRIHWSFWLLLVWVGFLEASAPSPSLRAAAWMMLLVLAVFVCIVVHEFGHAFAARAFGIRTLGIVLLPLGGAAMLERAPTRPAHELAIALAGPAMNLVLAPALVGAGMLMGATIGGAGLAVGSAGEFVLLVGLANIVLLVLNLIPAFPMDGGRALRAVLSMVVPRGRASRITGIVGQAFAALFVAYGLWSGDLFLILIGAFVFLASRAEAQRFPRPR